ncbi:AAA family ATPase [Streptomyces thioluteus]|uniref:AAA family ATPase n=1 Tax=Streptomyces thioluteus TaxID=66431 RepID=A0ABN3WRF8_STRTU
MGAGDGIGRTAAPRGLVDLRGHERGPEVLAYPAGAVVVVSGLPGSGKSTLLRRWSGAGRVVDPRDVHVACESVMPDFLPYAVYRPWARARHFRRLRAGVRAGGPLLVHDCGSRAWMRRWLSRTAGRRGRELHLVLLDVGPAEALAGQRARGRRTRSQVFTRHHRGLSRLLSALPAPGTTPHEGRPVPPAVAEAASVVLLDRATREHVRTVTFGR